MTRNSRILITGVAGFIGYHLARKLLQEGWEVLGIDNLNDYYAVELKKSRLANIEGSPGFHFAKLDLCDEFDLAKATDDFQPSHIVHLAAQAGVRYSLQNPHAYIQSNLVGFHNIIRIAADVSSVRHFLYASSSSVYGANREVPFKETHFVDRPVSLYAASKKSNELIAHCYSHLYGLNTTGMRFFTVYGPWGRPDMAYFSFTDAYFAQREIRVFSNGGQDQEPSRDFTFIDDVVSAITRLIREQPRGTPPYAIYNIGNTSPVSLSEFIETLEECLSTSYGRTIEFRKRFESLQPGDVPMTYADTDALEAAISWRPQTPLEHGLQQFADWHRAYHAP